MKKSKFLLPCVACLVVVLTLVSCKKGDTGPAGPAGPQGTQGTQGVQGVAGTANVIYSPWIDTTTFKVLDTLHNGAVIDTFWIADISAPKLTADILNQGEIKTYVNANTTADPVVYPLPFNNGAIFIDVVYATGLIELTTNANLAGVPFRYVLVPGGTAARSYKSINWNNYSEVKAYLHLKD